MEILVDTREQTPWLFDELGAEITRQALPVGDYCLPGDEYRFVIERKSPKDFIGTIGSGWARFQRELARARSLVVIVEAPLDVFFYRLDSGQLVAPDGESQLQPGFVYKRCAEIMGAHGCSLFFCQGREYAERMAWTILKGRAAARGRL
jgi:hypothetical protein